MADRPFLIDCAHYTLNGMEEDDMGFYVPGCACGWRCPPVLSVETATDALMQHAYEAGILTKREVGRG